MRKAALIVLGLSIALTILTPILWLIGLVAGIGGALIHILLVLTPLWIVGVVVGVVLLVISGRDAAKS